MSEKKILYIHLYSSPLPEGSDEVIVKDFNMESYFCNLLGRKLFEDAGLKSTVPYPGRLIADFEKFDKEAYRRIIQQWGKVLSALLISQSENDIDFIFKLPDSYISWLDRCDIPNAFQIKNYYTHATSVSIKRKYLFAIVHEVLKNKLDYFLQKNKGNIDRIVFSIDGINRDCYIVHLWKHILTRDYELWTLKEYKEWITTKKWGITVFFPVHGIMLGKTTMSDIDSNFIKTRTEYMFKRNDFTFKELEYRYVAYGNALDFFMDWDKDNIIERYALYYGSDFPPLWAKYGFNWSLSYLQWLELFRSMAFTVIIEDEPQIERCNSKWYMGKSFDDLEERFVLRALIKAHSKDGSLSYTLKFDYGNRNGYGAAINAKDSLYLIIASTNNGTNLIMNPLTAVNQKTLFEHVFLKFEHEEDKENVGITTDFRIHKSTL